MENLNITLPDLEIEPKIAYVQQLSLWSQD